MSTFVNLSHSNAGPQGLVFDSSGNLYVAESNFGVIEKITPGGVQSDFETDSGGSTFLAIEVVPEPGTALFGLTCLGIAVLRRRRASSV